jgi:hypothetical protein
MDYSQNKNWLYFREQADEANNDGIDDSVCLPASRLRSIAPVSDTEVALFFEPVKAYKGLQSVMDQVNLTVIQGDTFEVCNELVRTINSYPHSDGFITICDMMTTTDSAVTALNDQTRAAVKAHNSIVDVAGITINEGKNYYRYPGLGTGGAALTAISATALSVNTHYKGSVSTNTAMTIPSAAAGKAGDWICVTYTAVREKYKRMGCRLCC